MRTVVVRNGTRIPLGKQGENKAVRVVWPEIAEKYTKLYGDGRFELVVVQKGQAYPAVVNVDGPDLIWNVLAADVATVGAGSLELIYYVGDTIAKSQTWETFVEVSKSAEGMTEPPEPAKNWVDVVIKSSSDAKQAATESAESAKQAAESSTNAAESANEAQKSREAIENMEVSAVSLPPDSDATVEKAIADGKVKLTFGIPKGEKGESDIFWLTTNLTTADSMEGEVPIDKTAEEIISAYKSGKTIFWNIIVTEKDGEMKAYYTFTLMQSIILDSLNVTGDMYISLCGKHAESDESYTVLSGVISIHNNEVVAYLAHGEVALLSYSLPVESKLHGAARENELEPVTYAAYYDHVHPAPFPDWTNNIGKALFVNNANETPSQAFEWRDVPNGDFTSKVGDFLRVAEVDSNNKPTKWTTDSIGGIKEPMIVTFTLKDPSSFSFKADTLYDDIKEAANAGRIVYAFAPASSGGPLFARLVDARSDLVFSTQTNVGAAMIIRMSSDSYIYGTGINLLYCRDEIFGGGDFNAEKRRIKGVEEPIDPSDAATKGYVDKRLGSSTSLGLIGTTVGQTIKVKAIDADGKPTEWEAVELTSDDVGAISKDDLQNATNEALAQAKSSGEFDGADGSDGGYYTPSVTQPDENTMRLSFRPSKEGMTAISETDITLPSGGSGSVAIDSTLTVSGQAADAKAVGDALAKKQDKLDIRTALDDVAVAGAQYYLGEKTDVPIVLPADADVGQIVLVSWYNGDTAATLSITGTMLEFDFTPSANTRSEINALWDGTYWAVLGNEMAVPSEVTA